ncbi:choice-of-anchor J domain-containing protein, partial [Myroides guanonis]
MRKLILLRNTWFLCLVFLISGSILGNELKDDFWINSSYAPNLSLLPYYKFDKSDTSNLFSTTCASATNVGSKDAKSDEITLKWDNVAGVSWEYIVQKVGGAFPVGKGVSTSVNEVVVKQDFTGTNLAESSDYEFFVRTNCGVDGFGSWEGPYDFKTLCLAFASPFKETFNTSSTSRDCWTRWDVDNDISGTNNAWTISTSGFEGNGSMRFSGGYNKNHDDWLISPAITLNGGNYAITYYYKASTSYNNDMEVLLSKNGMNKGDFTTVLLKKGKTSAANYTKKTLYVSGITGDVYIAWRVSAVSYSDIYIDEVSVSEVDCIAPEDNVVVSSLETNKGTVSWTDDLNKSWEYFVQEAGGGSPVGSGSIINKNSVDVTKTNGVGSTNLKPNTEYEFYVRSNCGPGKYSTWVGPIKFRTPCASVALPYWEGFNKGAQTITCWNIVDNNNNATTYDGKWLVSTGSPFEGDQNMYLSGSGSPHDDWLISPTFDMVATKIYRLRYHYMTSSYYDNKFEVLLSSKGTALSDFTTELVPNAIYKNTAYKEQKVFVTGLTKANIAWHAKTEGYTNIYIDNVFFEEVIGCPEPLGLDVKDIKENGATLVWTDAFKATSWEYWIQDKGGATPTGAGTVVSKKEALATKDHAGKNLTPNTEYEYYVRTVCSDGKTSIWSGPFLFRTICSAFTLPFWEGFNSKSETIYCWDVLNVNKDGATEWKTQTYGQYEGNAAIYFYVYDYNKTVNTDDWLISPDFKFDTKKIYRFKYHYKTDTYSEDSNFEVLASNSGRNPSDYKKVIVSDKKYKVGNYIEHKSFIKDFGGTGSIAWHTMGVGSKNIYIDNVFLEEVLTCPEPLGLDVKDEEKNKATISWTDDFIATSWEYYVQEQGKGVPSSNGTLTSKKENIIDKEQSGAVLKPNTDYEFYVRTVCGGGTYSVWAGPFNFLTTCDVYSTPFWEGFNTNTKTIRCWSTIDKNNAVMPVGSTFRTINYSQFEGDQAVYYYAYNAAKDPYNEWLVSPTITLDGGMYVLKYHYKTTTTASYLNEFEVLLSTKGVDAKEFTTVLVPSKVYHLGNYVEEVVFLNGIKGDVNIAWHVNSKNSNYSYLYLDNVNLKKVNTCPEPYYVKVTGQTANSLDVEWQQTGGVTEWEVIVVDYDDDETATPIKTVAVTGTPSTTITGLASGKAYRVYVRAKCGSGNTFSDWSTSAVGGTLVGANDECVGALNIPINSGKDCLLTVSGSLNGATESAIVVPSCGGSFKKDAWFEFTATSSTHTISVVDLISFSGAYANLSFAIYDQSCSGMTNAAISCFSLGVDGFRVFKNFIPGQKYYVRVGSSSTVTDFYFDLCITSLQYLVTSPSGVDYTVDELVEDVLVLTNCDLVSNITYRTGTNFGGENGIGYFKKNDSDFGFEEGVILATNGVRYAMGPGGQTEGNDNYSWLGDDDLQKLLSDNGQDRDNHNASVIEFDFVPIVDTLKFDFIFASNEYGPSYQCSYSDVFAFFLTDLTTDEVSNLAVVPGTTIPVSVTTIHDAKYQGGQTCGDENKEYFDKYYGQYGLPVQNNPINYGGITVPMTAKSAVVPGRKYHIKLAIADYGDPGVNSAVFLKGGSFNLGNLDLGADLTVENGTALCSGEAKIIKTGLGTEGIEIKWYKDDVLIVGENAPDIEISESGTYKVVAKYVDINCEVTGEITAEIFPAISTVVKDPKSISICRNSLNSQQIDLSLAELDMFGSAEHP